MQLPEAHDPPRAARDRPRRARAADPRLPGPRPAAGADVVREGARASRPLEDLGAAAAGRAASSGSAGRWSTPPTCSAIPRACSRCSATALGVAVRRGDAGLAGRAAATPTASGRRTGTPASRRRPASRRTPRRRRPRSARPPGAAAGAVPALLRRAGAVPPPTLRRLTCCSSTTSATATWSSTSNGTLAHRDEAGVSPFDSVVQGGDAVWEGLRLLRRADLRARPSTWPGCAARRRRWRSRRSRPTSEIIEQIRAHAGRQRR